MGIENQSQLSRFLLNLKRSLRHCGRLNLMGSDENDAEYGSYWSPRRQAISQQGIPGGVCLLFSFRRNGSGIIYRRKPDGVYRIIPKPTWAATTTELLSHIRQLLRSDMQSFRTTTRRAEQWLENFKP